MILLVRLASVLLQGSLAMFPAGYRREYGEEHAWVLRLALTEAARCGSLPLLHFVAREGRDLPLALLKAHQKEWRVQMNSIRQFSPPPRESLASRQILWFLLPFLVALAFTFHGLIPGNIISILLFSLLALVLVVAIAGIFKRLPLWALPSLGLLISLSSLILFGSLLSPDYTPGLSELKEILWTNFMPGRVLYALISNLYWMMPGLLLLVALALLSTRLPALSAFRQQLGRDWTLLPLMLYASNLITPFMFDAYQGFEPYKALFLLILIGGVWLYLRASQPAARLAALLAATLLSGSVLSLGIYLQYPQQDWAYGGAGFPRWWETLGPLLGTLVFLAALGLMAAFGSRLSQSARPETARP